MHCSTTPIASRTRSREARRNKNDGSEVVVGVSSDDDDDDVVVVVSDEVPEKEASASGTKKRFGSDAMGSLWVDVSDEEEGEEGEEEDGDDDEDVQFLGEVAEEGKGSENCEDCGGDDVEVEGSEGEKSRREEAELGMKRKRKFGLDILVDHSATQQLTSVSQRTRSRFRKTKKQKLGTISQPICLDDDDGGGGDDDNEEEQEQQEEEKEEEEEEEEEEEDESLSDSDFDDDDLDDDDESDGGRDSDDEEYRVGGGHRKREGYACVEKVPKKIEELMGKRKYRKKKCGVDVVKILKDSMYGKGEVQVPLEAIDLDDDDDEEEPSSTIVLPSKKEKSTPPPEKSGEEEGEEEELDEIWVEMERGIDATPQSTGSASVISSLEEEGRGSQEVKCRDSYHRKGSAFERKKHEVHDRMGFGEVSDILLQDSTYDDKGEVPRDANVERRNSCMDLPLKFNFIPEEEPPPEKSEYEKELDEIWAQMECGLHDMEQENSAFDAQVENNTDCDDDKYPLDDPNTPPFYLCRRGKHDLFLDDETGLVCRYCLHIALDIKHWTPPFLENPCGKYDRRDYYTVDRVDDSFFDELQDQTSGYDGYNHFNRKGTVWDVIPGVQNSMYPHQCEAFEFLWNNLAGGIVLDELKGKNGLPNGSGCIISHAPGTGKTRLTIVFLQTYMELNPTCTPMIIAPKGILLTWEEEFKTWKVDIPFHNLNNCEYSGNENEAAMNLIRKYGRNASTQVAKWYCRMAKLYSWKLGKSILGVSYKLFEQLTRSHDKNLRKFLLEQPDLLVLDEGHTPRNSQSWIWKSVTEIQTKRRIILSGTPFQNNFDELYNTLCLARPKFAERNPREENRGKWGYLTNSFGKVTDDRRRFKILKEIRDMIRPFVHVHKGTILQDRLHGLRQMIVILKPTELQKQLLEDIRRERKKLDKGKQRYSSILKIEYEESLTAVHPALFDLSEEGNKFQRFRLNPEESAKTKFLMELIRLSGIFNEKVLVFSQFIEPLKLLTSQLKYHFAWSEGKEVLQMHGKLEARHRQASIKAFNDPKSKVRVMLASTKACYEGISLVGASRVVLLDVVWNPSVERQAISRAYRLGQKKFVYTYHLITVGTRDEEKCSRQAEKDELSELVFFDSDRAQHREVLSSAELKDKLLEQMVQQQKLRHIFEKVAIKKQNLL